MKSVFYVECSGAIWHSIAAECQRRDGWEPILWTGAYSDEETVRKLFPKAIFLSGPDAALGLQHDEFPWSSETLPTSLLADLSYEERIGLQMMDRMDPLCGHGFPHDHRRRHWNRLLAWWNAALESLKPDLIVFSIAPHIVFDFALLALARRKGISTFMFERIGLPGWVMPMSDYQIGSDRLRMLVSQRSHRTEWDLPQPFKTWLDRSVAGGEAIPANYQRKLERHRLGGIDARPSLFRAIAREVKRGLVLLRKDGADDPALNSYVRSRFPPHKRADVWEVFQARLRGVLLKHRLMRMLDDMSIRPADGEPYVLLALHYQPERATVPMGGLFGDQTIIVDALSSALPAHWKLYVKEHPWQLQPFGRGETQRSEDFYRCITRHKNVFFVSRDVTTASLVRKARAVATVTGSVGWDALCCGVPVLAFGAAWYRDCPGAFAISENGNLKDAISEIQQGSKPVQADLFAFCDALANTCVPGMLEPKLEGAEIISESDAARSMADELMKFCRTSKTSA